MGGDDKGSWEEAFISYSGEPVERYPYNAKKHNDRDDEDFVGGETC